MQQDVDDFADFVRNLNIKKITGLFLSVCESFTELTSDSLDWWDHKEMYSWMLKIIVQGIIAF